MQQAILTSAIQSPRRVADVLPFRAQNKGQLEILMTKEFPMPRRYFVANGPLGLRWIQTYLKGGDTKGILTENEIYEYEGKYKLSKGVMSLNSRKMSLSDVIFAEFHEFNLNLRI